jgi:uncharacterized protein (TIGR02246 family)
MISSPAATIHVAIQAANERFMQAFRHGDAAGLASLYSEDAQLLPPGSEVAHGWEAIRAFWQGAMDSGIKAAQLEITEVQDHGDSAIEVSRYTLMGAEEQVLDQGKYIVIWKQERGQWKLHRDIFNSSGRSSRE